MSPSPHTKSLVVEAKSFEEKEMNKKDDSKAVVNDYNEQSLFSFLENFPTEEFQALENKKSGMKNKEDECVSSGRSVKRAKLSEEKEQEVFSLTTKVLPPPLNSSSLPVFREESLLLMLGESQWGDLSSPSSDDNNKSCKEHGSPVKKEVTITAEAPVAAHDEKDPVQGVELVLQESRSRKKRLRRIRPTLLAPLSESSEYLTLLEKMQEFGKITAK